MTINQLTAVLLGLAGFALGLRQIILSPKNITFPCAPETIRVAMFIGAVTLAFMAALFYGHDQPYAGQAANPVAVLAGIFALYNAAMLWNVLTQRLPPGVWDRLNRVERRARNSPMRAHVEPGLAGAAEAMHRDAMNGHRAHH